MNALLNMKESTLEVFNAGERIIYRRRPQMQDGRKSDSIIYSQIYIENNKSDCKWKMYLYRDTKAMQSDADDVISSSVINEISVEQPILDSVKLNGECATVNKYKKGQATPYAFHWGGIDAMKDLVFNNV